MRNTLAIWQREMKSYFVSPIAYVVLTVFLFLSGFFFYSILTAVIQSTMMQSQFGQGSQPVDVPGIVSRSFFGTTSVVLLFMIPMLTMGLFAEEKRRGTMELLLTSPVRHFPGHDGEVSRQPDFPGSDVPGQRDHDFLALHLRAPRVEDHPRAATSASSSTGRRCWRWGFSFPRSPRTRSFRWSSPSAPSWCCG